MKSTIRHFSSANELHRLLSGGVLNDAKKAKKNFKEFPSETIRSFVLPPSLRTHKALNGEEISLVDRKHPIVLFYSPNQLAAKLLEEWQSAKPKTISFLQLIVNEGTIHTYLKKFYEYNLSKVLPSELHGNFSVWPQASFAEERQFLGIENRSIPHVFLVDRAGRLRWRACGVCSEEDKEALKRHSEKLVAERDEDEKKKSGRVSVI